MNKGAVSKFFKKITGGKRLVIIGIIGIALIGISSFFPAKTKEKSETVITQSLDAEKYRTGLEKQIKEIVEGLTNDKKARVIITLETGIRREYAGETEDSSSEKSDENGSNTSSDKKKKAITVKTSDGNEEALIVTEYMPQIRGVAIVCDTGGSQQIKEAITNAVTAALGITSKRVYIGGYAG